uniref:Interleukin n=1 Tax=Gallus gallus TaxID=9031 RepID=Q7T110_CHICK|nr:interleukin-2 [Gallus gallus]CAE17662.1 Interleukin-2 [Gallus gallus]CAJ77493.1 interleukin-2 [Gallus gallus]
MMCKVLIFGCISVAMLMTTAYGASLSSAKRKPLQTLIKDLEILENIKNKIHLELYTPTETQECTQQTLQCYLGEVVTLKKETEDDTEIKEEFVTAIQNIEKNLKSLTGLNHTGSECKICGANNKKKFPDFLHELTNFVRYLQK